MHRGGHFYLMSPKCLGRATIGSALVLQIWRLQCPPRLKPSHSILRIPLLPVQLLEPQPSEQMEHENYQPMQVGGGRRRSLTPENGTPLRRGLRPVVRATPRANGTVQRANQRRARTQTTSEPENLPEDPAPAPARALPAIPPIQQPSSRRQSPALLDEPPMIYADREPSPYPPTHTRPPSVAPPSREASLAPQAPYPYPLPEILPRSTSYHPSVSIATQEAGLLPSSRHPSLPFRQPSVPPPSRHPSLPFRQPSVPPPSRHPSLPFRQPSVPPPAGPRQPSVPPPAGPRQPSGSHSRQPSGHSRPPSTVPYEHSNVLGQESGGSDPSFDESPITVRPLPCLNIIAPTPYTRPPPSHPPPNDILAAHNLNVPPLDHTASPQPSDDAPPDFQMGSSNDGHVLPSTPTHGRSPPSTPTSGRRSNETLKILEDGYQELEEILNKIAVQAKLTPQQVAEAWHKQASRLINLPNYWNIYQAFFKAHEADERARLGSPVSDPASPGLISRCYKIFREQHSDDWKEIIETFELMEMSKTHDHTISQRSHTFNTIRRKICNIVDTAAAQHGFDAAIVMCGSIVNEDASLGFAHTTSRAAEFWGLRCNASPDTIIGHLKAHVYNVTSLTIARQGAPEEGKDQADNAPNLVPQKANQSAQPIKSSAGGSVNAQSEPLEDVESDDYSDPVAALKMLIINLVKERGVDPQPLQGPTFLWKQILPFLVKTGLLIEGWPYNVLMPGERHNVAARTKGINDLSLPEKREMISAIKSKKLTMRVIRDARLRDEMNRNKAPVIVEEPPPSSARDARGRRMFKNGVTDRNGPSRLAPNAAATRVKRPKPHKATPPDSSEVEVLDSPPPPEPRKKRAVSSQPGPSKPKNSVQLEHPSQPRAPPSPSSDDSQVEVEVPKKALKRKATVEPDKRAGKKRSLQIDDIPEPRRGNSQSSVANGGRRAKKSARAVSVFSSDEDVTLSRADSDSVEIVSPPGKSQAGTDNLPSSDEALKVEPLPRPRPRLVKKSATPPDPENPFQSADKPGEGTDHVVIASLRKPIEGPPESSVRPSTPSPKQHGVLPAASAPVAAPAAALSTDAVTWTQQLPDGQPPENASAAPHSSFPPATSQPSFNIVPPMAQDPYAGTRHVYPPHDRLVGPGYYPPMAYGQQQGYPGDLGFNTMGFDPRRMTYPDMVGYQDGVGSTGMYPREIRNPYNIAPGFGNPHDTQHGVYRGHHDPSFNFKHPAQNMTDAQNTLPLLPAPPNASS